MKITTLEYIHKLLKDEERKTNDVYRAARDLEHEYRNSETADRALIKSQKEAADEFQEIHSEAWNALYDFCNHEW